MTHRLPTNPALIIPAGTQVVSRIEIKGNTGRPIHPAGVVGVITACPSGHKHAYCVRFPGGYETSLRRNEIITLADSQAVGLTDPYSVLAQHDLRQYVIYSCIIGSRAYGLDHAGSDIDRRGVYLPPADLHWSLYGIPERLENPEAQDCYWELQNFLVLALKANPNVLECLYTPLVEYAGSLGHGLVDIRGAFLSKLVYHTYNGYALSQFKKLSQDLRTRGAVKWKHVMHLIRLLLQGITTVQEGFVPVRVLRYREDLLAILRGERQWEDVDRWRLALHREFDDAAAATKLPDRPDYELVNRFLVQARREMVSGERNDHPRHPSAR